MSKNLEIKQNESTERKKLKKIPTGLLERSNLVGVTRLGSTEYRQTSNVKRLSNTGRTQQLSKSLTLSRRKTPNIRREGALTLTRRPKTLTFISITASAIIIQRW